MIEAATAFTFFDKLLTALGLIRQGQKERSAKTDAALAALYKALNKTKPYLELRAQGGPRDRDREFSIAEAWQDASIPLREIDNDLAQRCFIKGGYWLEPEVWDDATIKQKGIAFSQVMSATEELLAK